MKLQRLIPSIDANDELPKLKFMKIKQEINPMQMDCFNH